MTTFLDPSFWLYFIYFFVAIFLAFFIPGDLLVKKLHLSFLQRVTIGLILGMVLWGWQGFIFGYLQLRNLSYVYLLIAAILWLRVSFPIRLSKVVPKQKDIVLLFIIILGVVVQTSAIFFTGVQSKDSATFFCTNAPDYLWHIALTNQIINRFPPFEPGMYGAVVQNYHYWSNLVGAELIRVFKLPLIFTQFQFLLLLVSLLLGLSAVTFGQIVKASRSFTRWLVFFLYFGGDIIYVLLFILGKGINFNMGSLEDGSKFLVNPPRAFAIIIFFVGISLLTLWIRKKDKHTGVVMAILLGTLISFKVYIGLFALTGLSFIALIYLKEKAFKMLVPIALAGVLSLIVYLPVNSGAGGLYFTGLWMFENFISQPQLGLIRLELARTIFAEHHNWIRVITYELFYIFLYVISIFGSKLLGLFQSKKSLGNFPFQIHIFLISAIVVSTILGLFFQQTSGGANSFNFLVSVFIIGSLYTALACFYWINKIDNKFLKYSIIVLVLLLTIIRPIYEGVNNMIRISSREGSLITKDEIDAMQFITSQHDDTSLVLVNSRTFRDEDSPYFSFLTNAKMFLSGTPILTDQGIDFSQRLKVRDEVFSSTNAEAVANQLMVNHIGYIVLSAYQEMPATRSAYFIKVAYKNKSVKLLKVSDAKVKQYPKN